MLPFPVNPTDRYCTSCVIIAQLNNAAKRLISMMRLIFEITCFLRSFLSREWLGNHSTRMVMILVMVVVVVVVMRMIVVLIVVFLNELKPCSNRGGVWRSY